MEVSCPTDWAPETPPALLRSTDHHPPCAYHRQRCLYCFLIYLQYKEEIRALVKNSINLTDKRTESSA